MIPSIMRTRLFFLLFLGIFTLFADPIWAMSRFSRSSSEAGQTPLDLGVRTLHLEDLSRSRPVVVELWYPTAQSGPIEASEPSVWVHPKERRNAPLLESAQKRPLILMSHGHRGDRREATWLAEALVKQGFVVAAVEHHGNSFKTYNSQVSLQFWERSKDISFALDNLLKIDWIKNQIDAERIGFVGYSMGGMTGLHLAGATAKDLKKFCISVRSELEKEIGPISIEEVDFSKGEAFHHEPRIRAMLLICPATFVFSNDAIQSIQTPLALIASLDDEVLPHAQHALRLIQNKVPHKLKLLRDKKVSHYAFLNRVNEQAKTLVKKPVAFDPPSYNRADIHTESAEFACQFFSEKLTP